MNDIIKKYKKQILCLIFILVSTGFTAYILGSTYIKKQGIILKPTEDFEPKNIIHYLQNDSAWSSEKIGSSNYTLGNAGCLITSVSGVITELGFTITPSELNKKLTNVDGFSNGNLIWYKIKEAVPKVDYSYSRLFTGKTIEKDLKKGLLPIVNVKYLKTGITHWVIVVGAKDGEFLVVDPANSELNPIPLSTHGNVFAYRVIRSLIKQ